MSVAYTVDEKAALARLRSDMANALAQLLNLQVISNSNALNVSRYATLALMKAEPNYNSVKLWILLGKNSAGDGVMSGQYYYDPSSAATANDSSVIQLNATATGRLIQIV